MLGRWIVSLLDTTLRLAALLLVWSVGGLFTILTLFSVLFPLALAAVAFMFFASHFILSRPFVQAYEPPQMMPAYDSRLIRAEKPKREDDLVGMLALLDEDDRYDVQQRIKQRLIDRIDDAGDGELDTFESLLGASGREKRKQR